MSINAGTVQAELVLNTAKYNDGIKSAEIQMTKFADRMQTTGAKMSKAGSSMTKKVTLPIVGISTAALKVAADFESSMSEVQAISGATGDRLEALEEKAKEMGATTQFSASESAQALKYMAMAGWDTEQMLGGLDGVMMLAAASGEDLASTSDIVTDALTAFGMRAEQATEFADLLASASSNANTNVGMMGESFKYVAPVFGALNYSAEDAALALGLMANAGIKGSQSGTALRGAINRLVKPTGEAVTAIDELGIKLTDADGEMLPFIDTMEQLREKFSGLTREQKAQYAATIFGQEAMSGMLAIIDASEEDFEKLTRATREYNGVATEMAEIKLQNLTGQLKEMRSKMEAAGIEMAETLIPMASKVVDKIGELVDKFTVLDDQTQENIVKFALIAAAIGPVLIITGKLITATGTITGLLGKYAAANATASTATTITATSIKGLSIACATAAGKIALVVGAIWLFNEALKDSKRGADSVGAASGILGYNMQNLQRDIENTKASLSGEKQAREEAIKSVNDYTDSVEAQRLKSQQAVQVQDTARRKYEEQKDIVSQVKDAMNELSAGIDGATGSMKKNIEEMENAIETAQELEKKLMLVYGAYRKIDASPKSVISKYMADYINRTGDISVAFNARGTDYWRGGWTWVGEEGPELMRLPAGTQIIPSDRSMDMVMNAITSLSVGTPRGTERSQPLRGGDIHQHITIHSPAPLSASEIARKNLQVSRQLAMEWGL